MNDEARNALLSWTSRLPADVKAICDLGSYNINGSVKEVLAGRFDVHGYDIVAGPGVDHVLEEGTVTVCNYVALTALGAFQCSLNPYRFKFRMDLLMETGGQFLLTTCAAGCSYVHTSSPGTQDCHRWHLDGLIAFLAPEFRITRSEVTEHPTIILEGVKL